MKRFYPLLFFVVINFLFFFQFFIHGQLPIPADTITGLYHPYRDFYAKEYPNGMPYDNSLITDPVRQQYPWKELGLGLLKSGTLPVWNPYSFAGTPFVANFQSAVFYPVNILFTLLPFSQAWSLLILIQPLLAGIFMFYYLRYLRIHTYASFLGGIVFAFSGFSVAWLEWGTIVQTGLWLPLILLAKEKLISKRTWQWMVVLIFAEVSMLFAGHLQTFFYAFVLSFFYLVIRIYQEKKRTKHPVNFLKSQVITFGITGSVMVLITVIQWLPTITFILLSARELDQIQWQKEGWFLPWQHLIQFIAPDFFGNPATLNYWGVWNYGEFIGYIGIIPLVFSLYAIFFRRDNKTYFSASLLALSFLFVLPTFIAKIPFLLSIPFLSSSQPTRLIFIIDFLLSFLAALGLDLYLKEKKRIYIPLGAILVLLVFLWLFVLKIIPSGVTLENLLVAKRNIYLPTVFLLVSMSLCIPLIFKKQKWLTNYIVLGLILVTLFDLFRFFSKFTAFSDKEYLYPMTKTISFLQKQQKPFRIMSLDSRILPPNFSTLYRIETIEGYDPLYLRSYGEFISSLEKGKPDISGPFGFNRIITPRSYSSQLIDLLNVKYMLSLDDIQSPKLKKVFEEGQTKVYENTQVMPRVFFVNNTSLATTKADALERLLAKEINLRKTAVIDGSSDNNNEFPYTLSQDNANKQLDIISYSENKIVLKTSTPVDSLLVLSDVYYPTWKAKIDGVTMVKIWKVNYTFRGIVVPKGEHTVEFYNTLF